MLDAKDNIKDTKSLAVKGCVQYFRSKMNENIQTNINSRNIKYQHCMGYLTAYLKNSLINDAEYVQLAKKLENYLLHNKII